MDPNSQNSQGDSEAVKKLENDLEALTQKAKAEQSLPADPVTVSDEQPAVTSPVVSTPPTSPVAPETPNTQPPPTETQHKPIKKGSPLMIVAVALIILAVIAVVVYMFGSKLLPSKIASTPTPVAIITTSPTPDPTASWKTYSNGEFSFKYPDSWSIDGIKMFKPDRSIEMWAFGTDGAMYNECQTLDNTQIIGNLRIKSFSGVTTSEMCGPVNLTLREKWIVKVEGEGFQPGLQYSYRTSSVDAEEIFNQILSTFKFTEALVGDERSVVEKYVKAKVFDYGKSHGLTSENQIIVGINYLSDNLAAGGINFTPDVEGSGESWYAAKISGQWNMVLETQQPPTCEIMNKYGFPKSVYGECV